MILLPSFIVLICCAFSWSEARLGRVGHGMRKNHFLHSEKELAHKQSDSNYTTYYFTQPLDHFNQKSKVTFKQRYWVETSHYKPGGPVILVNGGEGNAYPADGILSRSAFSLMAKEMNGIAILIEHRYYGESHLPLGKDPQFQFLTTNQSLADMARFMQQKNIKGIKGDVSAPKTKWIVRGGSYSGNLAAWMRYVYPDLVFAAVSSSAPVQAQYDFYQYFNPIIQYGPPYCVKAFHNVVDTVDKFFAGHPTSAEKKKFKARFNVEASASDSDFVSEISFAALGIWQDAYPENYPFDKFCKIFKNIKDPKKQFEAYQNWYTSDSAAEYRTDVGQVNTNGTVVSSTKDTDTDPYQNSWTWQICTEFGYWQDAPPRSSSWYNRRLSSNLITTDYYEIACKELFKLTAPPAIQTYNNFYQGWDLQLTRTIWINGEWDPWRPLSVASDDAPTKRQNTTNELYFMIPKGVHCFDYSLGPTLTELHKETISALKKWMN
ncbi:peptidase S28 [Chlamydoabsidia padenii]|nr:peptidase S28 [Chlamydoabsidia padenii]